MWLNLESLFVVLTARTAGHGPAAGGHPYSPVSAGQTPESENTYAKAE